MRDIEVSKLVDELAALKLKATQINNRINQIEAELETYNLQQTIDPTKNYYVRDIFKPTVYFGKVELTVGRKGYVRGKRFFVNKSAEGETVTGVDGDFEHSLTVIKVLSEDSKIVGLVKEYINKMSQGIV